MAIKVAIIKPVGNGCNLQCDYCYVEGRLPKIDMISINDAFRITDEVLSQDNVEQVEFLWHGGEPLLRGETFFREVFEYQKKVFRDGMPVYRNCIQSNLTLMNDDWIRFFSEYNINVSTSLDGPKYLHNAHRKSGDGKGTYDLVVDKIRLVQNAGLHINILTVISKTNMAHACEIFENLNALNINSVGFLPCYISSSNGELKYPTLDPGDYAEFIISFFELYLKHKSSFTIREFDQMFGSILGRRPDMCNYTGSCDNFICIDNNLEVYACDKSPHSNQYFGNLSTANLNEILNQREHFIRDIGVMSSECTVCEYLRYCNNGCYNLRENGKYRFCEDRKKVFCFLLEFSRHIIAKGGE